MGIVLPEDLWSAATYLQHQMKQNLSPIPLALASASSIMFLLKFLVCLFQYIPCPSGDHLTYAISSWTNRIQSPKNTAITKSEIFSRNLPISEPTVHEINSFGKSRNDSWQRRTRKCNPKLVEVGPEHYSATNQAERWRSVGILRSSFHSFRHHCPFYALSERVCYLQID